VSKEYCDNGQRTGATTSAHLERSVDTSLD
jgi:hypothetical protein